MYRGDGCEKKTDTTTRAPAVQIIRFSQTSSGGLWWQCWGHSFRIAITLLDFWSWSCWTQSWSLSAWDGLLGLVWVDLVLLLVNLTWPTFGNASLLDKAFSLSQDPGQLTFLWLLPGKVPLQPPAAQVWQALREPKSAKHRPAPPSTTLFSTSRRVSPPSNPSFCLAMGERRLWPRSAWISLGLRSITRVGRKAGHFWFLMDQLTIEWMLNGSSNMIQT